MRCAVTGGAGFIGSHLVEHLLADGVKVHVVDNFLTGRREFLPYKHDGHYIGQGRGCNCQLQIFEGSVRDHDTLVRAFDGCDWVIHMAANAEGRRGLVRPTWDIEQNVLGTSSVLEAMRAVGVAKIFYASSGSVYGNYQPQPVVMADLTLEQGRITEDCPFPTQTSLYGASKIAGEGLIGAYVEGHGFTGVIGRWMQAIGPRYLHGHVIDFVRKLQRDPTRLEMLGDGSQAKSGLYVKDLAAGIWTATQAHDGGLHVYNVGGDEMFTVRESAEVIAAVMDVAPEIVSVGETWPGDNPYTHLDSSRLRALGWKTEVGVKDAIERTARWLLSDQCRYL